MSKLTKEKYEGGFRDCLDGIPLKDGDRIKATFLNGQVIETTISIHSRGISSSPTYGDFYDDEAFIVIIYYGSKGELSIRSHPEILVERI